MNQYQKLSLLFVVAMLVSACGASVKQTACTDADGNKYPFGVRVTQPLAPVGMQARVLACATTESVNEEQKAELQTLYPRASVKTVQARNDH